MIIKNESQSQVPTSVKYPSNPDQFAKMDN